MKTHAKHFGLTLTAVLLLAVFLAALLPLTAFADGETHIDHDVDTNNDNNVIVDKNVTVGTNNGLVVENNGTINTNNAGDFEPDPPGVGLGDNNGLIVTNNGVVNNNNADGTIVTNAGGWINTNSGEVGTNTGWIETNNKTVTTNDLIVRTNNSTVETNNDLILTNNDEVETNNGDVDTNKGTVEFNGPEGRVWINDGTVTYNAGGTVTDANDNDVSDDPNQVKHNGYGLTVEDKPDGVSVNVSGSGETGASNKAGTLFFVEKNDSVTATVGKKAGYSLGVDGGGTAFTKQETGGGWTVSFSEVLNNLILFFTKDPAAPAAAVMDVDPNALNNAFNAVNADWAAKIRAAAPDSTLELEADPWGTLSAAVGEAVRDRGDVTVVFLTSTLEGGKLTLPAGTDLLGMMNGKSVISFPDLAKLLK